jgi:hypothetical protein
VRKLFTSIKAARSFYLAKDRAGKEPTLARAEPTLYDLPVRYFGDGKDGGDPLQPELV